MSKQSMGKTLLRNVIRHTDAHNKIQEEMEMWKMRDWEIQASEPKHLSECVRGQMHCDRTAMPQQTRHMRQVSEHDDREARICTRRLYEFEANDPDRWGHNGFKELYPEEFESDSEKSTSTKSRKRKKSKSAKEAKSKKASQRKKKKKKKKEDNVKRKKEKSSSSEDSIDDSCAAKGKQRRKSSKSRHKSKKRTKVKGDDDDDSRSGDADRKRHSRTKRKLDSIEGDSGLQKKKKRKNWKLAGEESSGDSSAN